MILFWSLAAAMVAAALALVLLPLLRGGHAAGVDQRALNVAVHRDRLRELEAERSEGSLSEELFTQAKEELERDLLQDVSGEEVAAPARGGRWMVVVAALVVPLLTVGLYLGVGMPQAVDGVIPTRPDGAPDVDKMLASLEAKLAAEPNNLEGWMMLGRSYSALERYREAAAAFGRAAALEPDNPDVILYQAEAIANGQGGNMAGQPEALVKHALSINPQHASALWMSGIIAFQNNRFEEAVADWEQVLQGQEPGSDGYKMVFQALSEARANAGMPPLQAPPVPAAAAAAGGPTVTVKVDISAEMARQAGVDDALFIYARAAEGPKAPLAMSRHKVSELPLTVTLDNSMSMVPGMDLSAFPQVVIYARVSKSGQAMAAAGDLEGKSEPLTPAEGSSATVHIDHSL
ncbi:c-type cytochrome biogenesis protein CcmI [Endothiovibrio diazotrophicus]